MKEWTRRLAVLGAAALTAASVAAAADMTADIPAVPAAHGQGKLDLDIYAPRRTPPRSPSGAAQAPLHGWVPGDPRAARGEPSWVRHLSHAGYAGLGAVGLAVSVASGGVAPAVGFGIVAIVQSYLEWKEIKNTTMDL
jgi:hypothetical protein